MALHKVNGHPSWKMTDDKQIMIMVDYDVKTDANVFKITLGPKHKHSKLCGVTITWITPADIPTWEVVDRARAALEVLLLGE